MRRRDQDAARHHAGRHRDGRPAAAARDPDRASSRSCSADPSRSSRPSAATAIPSREAARRDATRPLSRPTTEALARFRHALRVFQRFSEDAARRAGLTPAQHQLLLAVKGWAGDEPPTIGDVADVLQLKHHSAVELVQRAAAAGLVETAADPADGRRQLLALTDAGEAKLASLSLLHRDELRRFRPEMNDVLRELD